MCCEHCNESHNYHSVKLDGGDQLLQHQTGVLRALQQKSTNTAPDGVLRTLQRKSHKSTRRVRCEHCGKSHHWKHQTVCRDRCGESHTTSTIQVHREHCGSLKHNNTREVCDPKGAAENHKTTNQKDCEREPTTSLRRDLTQGISVRKLRSRIDGN